MELSENDVTKKKSTIYSALLEIQKELPPIGTDGHNNFHNNDYATLPYVLDIMLPVINKYGVVFFAHPDEDDQKFLIIHLYHVESHTEIKAKIELLNRSDMQKWGGSATYAERRGFLMLLGRAADKDLDGEDTKETDEAIRNKRAEEIKKENEEKKRQYEEKKLTLTKNVLEVIHEKENKIMSLEDEKAKFIRSVIMDPTKLDSIKTLDKLNEIYFWIKSL